MAERWVITWLLAWLVVWTIWDLRCREIYMWQGLLVLAVGVVHQVITKQLWTGSVLGGILIGMLAWSFSCLSRERFGKGDSMVILCLGLYLGASLTLSVWLAALLLSSAAALYLLWKKKCSPNQAIPFIPFLAMGYLWIMWIR